MNRYEAEKKRKNRYVTGKKGMKYMMYSVRVPGANTQRLPLLRFSLSRADLIVGRGVTECSPLKPGKYWYYVLLASGMNVRGRSRQQRPEGSVNEKGKGTRRVAHISMREKR